MSLYISVPEWKKKQQEQVKKDVEEFLKQGGQIEKVKKSSNDKPLFNRTGRL